MNLDKQQILQLLFPFLISIFVYYFSSDITKNIKIFFPSYEEYTNKTLDKKADIYLKIESKNKLYQTIISRVKYRNANTKWIANQILYKDFKVDKHIDSPSRVTHIKKDIVWRLEAIFNDKKVIILNGKMLKLNSMINGVKVLKIKHDSVLLKYKKVEKWVYLFH